MGSGKRVKNSLISLGSAAVLAVYAAGYMRTKSAADRIDAQAEERRPSVPTARSASTSDAAQPYGAATPAAAVTADGQGAEPHTNPAPSSTGTKRTASAPTPPESTSVVTSEQSKHGVSPAADPSTAEPVVAQPAVAAQTPAVPTTVAPTSAPVDSPAVAVPAAPVFKDGLYSGWGSSRHGQIEAAIEVKDGHIVSASISQCLMHYSCSWISMLPPEVVARQSADVDYVSGATQSANAFYFAVVDALSKAK